MPIAGRSISSALLLKRRLGRQAVCGFATRFFFAMSVAICVARNVNAQLPQAREFYERDYAVAPGVAGQGGGAQARPRPRTQPAGKDAELRSVGRGKEGDVAGRGNSPLARGRKRKLLVDVTVSSSDPKHLLVVVEAIKHLYDSRLVFVRSVTHIGDYRSITDEIENELARRGIPLSEGVAPPEQDPPPLSPRWEIHTREGTHIAEGYLSLEPLINEYGEYDPRQRAPISDQLEVIAGGF